MPRKAQTVLVVVFDRGLKSTHWQPPVVSLGSYDNRKRKANMCFPRIVRRNPIIEVAIDYGQVWETMDVCPPP